jgi:DNA-binding transcriptional MerR regulator
MLHIPSKNSFNPDEVCTIVGVKPYVLRFWESEFEQLNPILSEDGQKIYSRKHIDSILNIKELLFDQKLSIPKAKFAIGEMELETLSSSAAEVPIVTETIVVENQNNEFIAELEPVLSPNLDLNTVRCELAKIRENLNNLKDQIR